MYGTRVDERAIAQGCARGDRAAWEEFLSRFARFIAFAARRFAGEAADEVSQNTYLALLKEGGRLWTKYDPAFRLTTFLGLIVRSQADRHRRRRREAGGLEIEIAADAPAPASDVPLERALEGLTARERLILRLHYDDGLAYKEIAAALRIPLNTVASHLLRARNKLKDAINGGRPRPQ